MEAKSSGPIVQEVMKISCQEYEMVYEKKTAELI